MSGLPPPARAAELLSDGIPEETTPTPLGSRLRRAGALYDERRLPEAELELQEALRLAPDDLRAWRLLARVRLRLGRLADARAAFAAIASRSPEDGEARFQLGIAAVKVGDFPAAAAELEAAVRLRPTDTRAQQYLAYAWARLGRATEAAEAFARVGAPELASAVRAGHGGASSAGGELEEMPVASLAADNLLPRETGIPGGTRLDHGVHRLAVEEGSETHVAPGSLLTLLGAVTLEPAIRRRPGRVAEPEPDPGVVPRYLHCRGQGEIWLGPTRPGGQLLSLRVEDDELFLREARVRGFSGALSWETGTIPRVGTRLLHFRGHGVVVVDFAAAEVVAVHVSLAHRPMVPEGRLLGWMGPIVLQPDDSGGGSKDGSKNGGDLAAGMSIGVRVLTCEGEGVLLLARHGQAEQPVHERAELGDHGAGRPDPGDPDLHR